MTTALLTQSRIDRVRQEVEYARNELTAWLALRRARDPNQQYHIQLNALETILGDGLTSLSDGASALKPTAPLGDVYREARGLEEGLVFVRHVWGYYRSKFDQRDDPVLSPILKAADEVVWSCYAEPFRNIKDKRVLQGTAPLPFVATAYSPRAVPRVSPPPDLQSASVPLAKFLKQLPIPVVSLPPLCVRSPWWLICLGHEVGHHLQFDLLPDARLVGEFRDSLEKADETRDWGPWGQEVFADACSVFALGPPAVWVLAELVMTDEQRLLRPQTLYPAPVVRLALLTELARSLAGAAATGLTRYYPDPAQVVQGPPVPTGGADLRARAKANHEAMPRVVAALRRYRPGGLKPLEELFGWARAEFNAGGRVQNWAANLHDARPLLPYPKQELCEARLMASAGATAWSRVMLDKDSARRDEGLKRLTDEIPRAIVSCREAQAREAKAPLEVREAGGRLVRLLRRLRA